MPAIQSLITKALRRVHPRPSAFVAQAPFTCTYPSARARRKLAGTSRAYSGFSYDRNLAREAAWYQVFPCKWIINESEVTPGRSLSPCELHPPRQTESPHHLSIIAVTAHALTNSCRKSGSPSRNSSTAVSTGQQPVGCLVWEEASIRAAICIPRQRCFWRFQLGFFRCWRW